METQIFKNIDAFKASLGKPLPDGEWYRITQQMINDFANATLDKQWIHIDEERAAKESPFNSNSKHSYTIICCNGSICLHPSPLVYVPS